VQYSADCRRLSDVCPRHLTKTNRAGRDHKMTENELHGKLGKAESRERGLAGTRRTEAVYQCRRRPLASDWLAARRTDKIISCRSSALSLSIKCHRHRPPDHRLRPDPPSCPPARAPSSDHKQGRASAAFDPHRTTSPKRHPRSDGHGVKSYFWSEKHIHVH